MKMNRRKFTQTFFSVCLVPILNNIQTGTANESLETLPDILQTIPNGSEVLNRLKSPNGIRVGFYGTVSGGCRGAQRFIKELQAAFPKRKIESFWRSVRDLELAPYRFGGDVLIQDPDLVVLDFPHGKQSEERVSCITEALIRKTLLYDSGCGMLGVGEDGRKFISLQRNFNSDGLERATAIVPFRSMRQGEWFDDILTGQSRPQYAIIGMPIWSSNQAGARISFRFIGTSVKIDDIPAPDGAQLKVILDGKELPKISRLAPQIHSATFSIGTPLADQEHTVSLEILPDDKGRTFFRISRILIIGELKS